MTCVDVFFCSFTNFKNGPTKNMTVVLGGGFLHLFGIFTPIPGDMFIQFDGCIFFRWVGEKPPTRIEMMVENKQTQLLMCFFLLHQLPNKNMTIFWIWCRPACDRGVSLPPPKGHDLSSEVWKSSRIVAGESRRRCLRGKFEAEKSERANNYRVH